ncbi:MAG: nickel transporter [Methanobacteriota archaeon]|nr:MAG: nickel transporter [Euryarchaeota archaeon]
MKQLIMELNKVFSEIKMEENTKTELIQYIHTKFENSIDIFFLQLMLQILYEYEKRYLDLIREYKEEIKLSATIQEDLRKERTNFFSEALKEVSNTLKESQVDSDIASQWIKELVNSYTRSLDICSGLIEEETISMIGEIRRKVKRNRSRLRKSSCFVWRNRL